MKRGENTGYLVSVSCVTSHQLLESRRDRRNFFETSALARLVEDKHVVTLADAGVSLSYVFSDTMQPVRS